MLAQLLRKRLKVGIPFTENGNVGRPGDDLNRLALYRVKRAAGSSFERSFGQFHRNFTVFNESR